MQPLPRAVTASILVAAADAFTSAAHTLGSRESVDSLRVAAGAANRGLPSLRATVADSRGLTAELQVAATAAVQLASRITAAPSGADFSSHRDALLGWAGLAAGAARLVDPPAYA